MNYEMITSMIMTNSEILHYGNYNDTVHFLENLHLLNNSTKEYIIYIVNKY